MVRGNFGFGNRFLESVSRFLEPSLWNWLESAGNHIELFRLDY